MRFKTIKIIALVIAGYLFFCCFGILPKHMSLVKFPSFIQQYKTAYTYVGYTYQDKLDEEIDKTVIKKGAFDSLGLFNNGNLKNGGYFDSKKERFYLNLNDDAVKFKGKKNLREITTRSNVRDGVVIRAGKYYYSLCDDMVRVIMTKNESFAVSGTDFDAEDFDYASIVSLLKKQREEKITLREFAQLLRLVKEEILVYYSKDAQTVLFKEMVDENHYIIVSYNMDDNSVKKSKPRLKHEHEFFVYSQNLLFYDETSKSIKMFFMETQTEMDLVTKVDSVDFMNYVVYEDGTLMFSYVADNKIYWKYPLKTTTGEFGYTDLKLTDGQVFLVSEEKAVLYKNPENNQISYVYTDIPEYTKESD